MRYPTTKYSILQKWKPGQHIHLMFFLLYFAIFLTELEKQLSDKCLNFNVTYKHFMHRSETIPHVRGSERGRYCGRARSAVPERARARRIECKSFYHCEVTFLGVSARTFAHQLGRTHTHTDKKLEKKLNYLYALVGYRSVCSLLSPSRSLSLAAPQHRAAASCKCAFGVCAEKYATHFNRKGLHKM